MSVGLTLFFKDGFIIIIFRHYSESSLLENAFTQNYHSEETSFFDKSYSRRSSSYENMYSSKVYTELLMDAVFVVTVPSCERVSFCHDPPHTSAGTNE